MRTHELAVFLRDLSDVLTHFPDTEITSLPEILKPTSDLREEISPASVKASPRAKKTSASIDGISKTLATLSKKEIVELVDESSLNVSIRSKDSAKDAANKIKRHLIKYPDSSKRVNIILKRKHPVAISEPLSKALGTLLGNRDATPTIGSR